MTRILARLPARFILREESRISAGCCFREDPGSYGATAPIYFKYLDSDYADLKKILGVDPLNSTIVKCGTFEAFRKRNGKPIRHLNPPHMQVSELLSLM